MEGSGSAVFSQEVIIYYFRSAREGAGMAWVSLDLLDSQC